MGELPDSAEAADQQLPAVRQLVHKLPAKRH